MVPDSRIKSSDSSNLTKLAKPGLRGHLNGDAMQDDQDRGQGFHLTWRASWDLVANASAHGGTPDTQKADSQ